jgi:hypothetical protein
MTDLSPQSIQGLNCALGNAGDLGRARGANELFFSLFAWRG